MWRMSRTVASAPSRSALLTTNRSPISRMPALAAWMPSPIPGASSTIVVSAESGDLDLGLPDADGLDEDDVAAGRVEDPQRLRGGPGQAAEVAAGGHRADVDARGRGRGPACGPGRRAARRRRTASDGSTASTPTRLPALAEGADQGVRGGRLADPGRAGEADDVGGAAVRRQGGHHLAQRRVAVLDEGDQPGHGPRRACPGRLDQGRDVDSACGQGQPFGSCGTRTIRASPWPPPPQSAAAPTPPPRRFSSSARCRTMRAPDMPIGWPRAMAPPLTLTLSRSRPRSLAEARPTAAKASLISMRSRSDGADALLRAGLLDRAGRLRLQAGVGSGHVAVGADLGEPGQAQLLGLGLAHDDDRGGAVGDLRGGTGGDGAVLGERRAQLAEGVGRWCRRGCPRRP